MTQVARFTLTPVRRMTFTLSSASRSITLVKGDEALALQLATFMRGAKGDKGDQGDQGPQGAGGDLSYVHTQGVASATWVIAHNLGKFPAVFIEDSLGDDVEGAVTYDGPNQITVAFSAAFSGRAILN